MPNAVKPLCLLLALSLFSVGCTTSGIPQGATPLPPVSTATGVALPSGQPPPRPPASGQPALPPGHPAPSGQPAMPPGHGAPSGQASSMPTAEWHRFTAQDGSWSVEVPGPFEDDRTSIQVHRYATVSFEEGKPIYEVALIEVVEADRATDRATMVHSFVEGLVKGSPRVLKREQSRVHHVYPAERVIYELPHGRRVLAQVFGSEKYLWSMQITVPESVKDMTTLGVPRFMDSIEVKDKPATEKAGALPAGSPIAPPSTSATP